MTYFCPSCWKEVDAGEEICPHCGAVMSDIERKDFEGKLINALGHPERNTVQRAVWILGRLKSIKSIKPLIDLFNRTGNPFLKVEILDTLAEIDTQDALEFIGQSLNSEASMVRRQAREIIDRIWASHGGKIAD